MRFCMITTFYPPFNFGGDGIFIERLSGELARRGHHVEVIHCEDAYRVLAGRGPSQAPREQPGVAVHRLKSPLGWLSPLATHQTGYPLLKSRRIREVLAAGFDVINYHNVSLVGGPGVLRYGTGIKLYTLHEYWLVCPTHSLFKFNRAPCAKQHCVPCTLSYRRPPQWWRYTPLLRSAVRHVDAFICPDRFTMAKQRELGLDVPVVHMPHFVPLAEGPAARPGPHERPAPPTPLDGLPDAPYFLFVGRLEKLKGLHTVIPLFRRFRKARLLIAGAGTYEPELRRLAEGAEGVRFLGYQTGQALDELYRRAVALIVPSINFEVAPPLVIMEAFRHGTPAIVRQLGSMPEIIEDSGGGLVYATDGDLGAAMDALLNDPAYRDALGQRARDALHARWTPSAYLERYLGLIDRIREEKAGRTAAGERPA
jgi:glycosyltransferase involved in cell wall biosynthesis